MTTILLVTIGIVHNICTKWKLNKSENVAKNFNSKVGRKEFLPFYEKLSTVHSE